MICELGEGRQNYKKTQHDRKLKTYFTKENKAENYME